MGGAAEELQAGRQSGAGGLQRAEGGRRRHGLHALHRHEERELTEIHGGSKNASITRSERV